MVGRTSAFDPLAELGTKSYGPKGHGRDPPAGRHARDRYSAMQQQQPPSDSLEPDPEERDQETLDRELDELTSELRMVIPGVTVLLAFLLGIPFTSAFSELNALQSDVYFAAFLSTALAVVFLMGESAYHQIRGKPYSKGRLLKTAIRQMVTALILLGISISAVVFLVTDLIFGALPAALLASAMTLLILGMWFGLPLLRRWRRDR